MNCAKDVDIKVFFIHEEMYFRNVQEEITSYQNSGVLIINVRWLEEREKMFVKTFFNGKSVTERKSKTSEIQNNNSFVLQFLEKVQFPRCKETAFKNLILKQDL